MDSTDFHQETLVHIKEFELHDFVEDPYNLDHQFINLICWENKDAICNFNSEPINECFIDNSFLSYPAIPSDQCNIDSVNVHDPSSTVSSFSCFDGEAKGGGEEENEIRDSSATTTTTTATKSANTEPRPKTDRSKTLVSERRRRDRMKEKLYTLRSLVPNITKMDKASIIGDAVSYVHELQAQAKMLKAEVEGLETSLLVSKNYQGSIENPVKVQFTNNSRSICKKIIQAKGSEPEINLANLKLWVTEAFVNQGFEFIPFLMLDSFNL
ncbi:Transcription factor FER IRON DEFICIENCY-INDUCED TRANSCRIPTION FACTOR [Spatholobus suberectus]|nr:Transcription factor FER IRON DEFICIENCY-INDUCED TRANSCRIPTION FACTOR [Spatholobus suberectus]